MKIAIVSYSYTGNNERFAAHLAESLSARRIILTTAKPVTNGTILRDLLFQSKPQIDLAANALTGYDLILAIAPVWMGQVAFPLRRLLDAVKKSRCAYAFLSVSGGADGSNPKLERELTKRTGRAPVFVLDQQIRALLPASPAPTREDTSKYQLTEQDCQALTNLAKNEITRHFPNALA